MKNLKLSLLFLLYTTTIIAQLEEKLYQEFCEFVEAQKAETTLVQHKKPALFLPIEKSSVAHKNSEKMQVLDSIVFDNNSTGQKQVDLFEYDNKGRQIIASKTYYNEGKLTNTVKLDLKYDKGNLIEIIYTLRHEFLKLNHTDYKVEYFYNNNNLIESRFFSLNNNKWTLMRKVEHKFNTKNQLSEITRLRVDSMGVETARNSINYKYEENTIVVNESFRDTVEYTLNKAGQLLESCSMGVSPNQLQFKRLIFYNKNGDKTEEKYLNWLTVDSLFMNIKIDAFYTYGADNKLIEQNKLISGTFSGQRFVENTNTFFTYDLYGYPLTFIIENQYENRSPFENSIKYDYVYDDHGNLHKVTTYYWDINGRRWEEQISKTNTFNLDFKTENILFPKYFVIERGGVFDQFEEDVFTENYRYEPAKPQVEVYDKITSIFQNFRHMKTSLTETFWGTDFTKTYHYSERKLKFTSKAQPFIKVYPNPASRFFTIDMATLPINTTIKMYNLNGEKVMDMPLPVNNDKIFINHLPRGLYYFRLHVSNVAIECTGKVMVK